MEQRLGNIRHCIVIDMSRRSSNLPSSLFGVPGPECGSNGNLLHCPLVPLLVTEGIDFVRQLAIWLISIRQARRVAAWSVSHG